MFIGLRQLLEHKTHLQVQNAVMPQPFPLYGEQVNCPLQCNYYASVNLNQLLF